MQPKQPESANGQKSEIPQPTSEDLQIAEDLINEDEVLRKNERVKQLLENEFVTEDGRQLDPGNFLAAMLDFIKTQSGSVTDEQLDAELETQMVVHSRPTRH